MSSNVGLSTPRGSGTSGYIQKNWAFLKARDNVSRPGDFESIKAHKQRVPDAAILEHDRKREVEVKCLELQDKLEEQEDPALSEEEIEERVDALRKKLTAELEDGKRGRIDPRGLKPHQVHELAVAKLGTCTWPNKTALTTCSGERETAQCTGHQKGLRRREPLASAGRRERATATTRTGGRAWSAWTISVNVTGVVAGTALSLPFTLEYGSWRHCGCLVCIVFRDSATSSHCPYTLCQKGGYTVLF